MLGKAHKQRFKKGKHTSKEVLEYIHFDLRGALSSKETYWTDRHEQSEYHYVCIHIIALAEVRKTVKL